MLKYNNYYAFKTHGTTNMSYTHSYIHRLQFMPHELQLMYTITIQVLDIPVTKMQNPPQIADPCGISHLTLVVMAQQDETLEGIFDKLVTADISTGATLRHDSNANRMFVHHFFEAKKWSEGLQHL